jgi:opacity protein-like surface antigen
MKKFFIVMCMMLASATSFAQKGEMDLGIHAGFMLDSPNNIGIGANIGYMLTNNIRGVGEFNYFLKKDGVSYWNLEANVEYLFKVGGDFTIYPLIGLDFLGQSWDGGSDTRLGLNLGAGVEYPIADHLKLRGEFNYKTQGNGWSLLKAGIVIPF